MFSNLRLNNQLYILHKDATPFVETGTVTNVTAPMPQLPSVVGQPMLYTVDVTVKVNDQLRTFQKLPANLDVADFAGNGNIFISSSKEGINAEVQAMRQRSMDVLASVDYHQGVIAVCDKIEQELNPEKAQKAAQQAEIEQLKSQVATMSHDISELLKQNKDLINQLKAGTSEGTNK